MKKSVLALSALIAAALALGSVAHAAGGEHKPYKSVDWGFKGPFGRFDAEAVQRGFQVYREVCAACHSLDYVSFRNLGQPGGPFYLDKCPAELNLPESTDCSNPNQNPIVRAIAADYQITDGPDDSGDMFQRPGLPSDRFPGPYENAQLAALANGGAVPPDMSLLTKARKDGPDYIYSLLTGYGDVPEVIEVPAGQYYNPYYAGDTKSLLREDYVDEEGHLLEGYELPYGGVFKMAAPLSDGIVTYADGSPETVSQYAKDVVYFLHWAAEPKLEARKKMGVMTMAYLLIFAVILWMATRQIWSQVK